MANSDAERRVIRARIKANHARTRIEKESASDADYDRNITDFVKMCMLSGDGEAELTAKIMTQQHFQWKKDREIC